MSLFGQPSFGSSTNTAFGTSATTTTMANPNKDIEVSSPPDDSISSLAFSPPSVPNNFLVAGSWDNNVRCWEITAQATTVPKAQQTMGGPILDTCWHDDGSKVFMASCDKQVKCWDLGSNQTMQVTTNQHPVLSSQIIFNQSGGRAPGSSEGVSVDQGSKLHSSDDLLLGQDHQVLGHQVRHHHVIIDLDVHACRAPTPILNIDLPERAYCADVDFPMAVVGTAGRGIIIYQLDGGQPKEYKKIESPLKYQHRCVSIFRDKKTSQPTGFALGSVEGRVAIQYLNPPTPKDNFTFKCHRSNGAVNGFQVKKNYIIRNRS